ncbi:MAG: serine/threonine-protein kinase [Planctomycetota bacterium]
MDTDAPQPPTTWHEPAPTVSGSRGRDRVQHDTELIDAYERIAQKGRVAWTGHHRLIRMLGRGGQGEVYLTEYRGTDNFTVPVAMKVFSPERFAGRRSYEETMARIAGIAARVALIQHDNLLEVLNFFDRNNIRVMMMGFVDGYDLRQLIGPNCLAMLDGRVDADRWEYINRVVLTAGSTQSRFKPGVAVAIVREMLSALGALHREGIVHGDVKPANIMLKRSGHAKLIDVGSAIDVDNPPRERECTPMYAAPEVLEGGMATPQSDLASLGYVLIELLAGQSVFNPEAKFKQLLVAKRDLPQKLTKLLPQEVRRNEMLMKFLQRLISPDPSRRYVDAETAEHVEGGAAAFHRQLVMGDMATEYTNDIRVWMEELKALETDTDEFDFDF